MQIRAEGRLIVRVPPGYMEKYARNQWKNQSTIINASNAKWWVEIAYSDTHSEFQRRAIVYV